MSHAPTVFISADLLAKVFEAAQFRVLVQDKTLGERAEAIRRAEVSLIIHEAIEDPFAENVRRTLAEWKA